MIIARDNNKTASDISEIKLFLFDLDGVIIRENKLSSKDELKSIQKCISDFASKLEEQKFYAGVITGRDKDELTETLDALDNCFVITSSIDKAVKAEEIINELNISFQNVLYVGDGILDIPLLSKVGISIAPKSARREVKRVVDFVLDVKNCEELINDINRMIEGEIE